MVTYLWISFFVLLFVDLIVWMVRSSMVHVRVPHFITLREQRPEVVERTMVLLESPRLRIALRMLMAILHFLLAGTIYLLWTAYRPDLSAYPTHLLVLLVSAILLMSAEYILEGRILNYTETWAMRFTPLARLINAILTPLSSVMLLLLGTPPASQGHQPIPVTEDELKSWVEEDQPESTLEKGERRMIYSIFQFGETLCREIMVPRIDVLALEIHTPLGEAIQAFTGSGHSRVPIYEESIDNIIGVLYAKDMLKVQQNGESLAVLRDMLRPAYFVPEAKKVDELLAEMRGRSVHIAIVVDEYGGVAGLVTLEDIMEEIFGEIRDEYDQSEELPYQQITPDEYLFQGRIDLDDFNDMLGTHLVKDVAETLGGYISSQVGHVPAGGETLDVEEWTLTVEQVIGRRIRKVRVRREPAPEELEENGSNAER